MKYCIDELFNPCIYNSPLLDKKNKLLLIYIDLLVDLKYCEFISPNNTYIDPVSDLFCII